MSLCRHKNNMPDKGRPNSVICLDCNASVRQSALRPTYEELEAKVEKAESDLAKSQVQVEERNAELEFIDSHLADEKINTQATRDFLTEKNDVTDRMRKILDLIDSKQELAKCREELVKMHTLVNLATDHLQKPFDGHGAKWMRQADAILEQAKKAEGGES